MDKCLSKWPWFSQIGHIEWIGFSQIDHSDLNLSKIDHYDSTFSQTYLFDELAYLLSLSYLPNLT
jgi:hypothetical protein